MNPRGYFESQAATLSAPCSAQPVPSREGHQGHKSARKLPQIAQASPRVYLNSITRVRARARTIRNSRPCAAPKTTVKRGCPAEKSYTLMAYACPHAHIAAHTHTRKRRRSHVIRRRIYPKDPRWQRLRYRCCLSLWRFLSHSCYFNCFAAPRTIGLSRRRQGRLFFLPRCPALSRD